VQHFHHEVIHLGLFSFSLLGKAMQWFYANQDDFTTLKKCSNAFLAEFFPLGKTNALWNKISSFRQLADQSVAEAWERF
jgi:hypothetical protein